MWPFRAQRFGWWTMDAAIAAAPGAPALIERARKRIRVFLYELFRPLRVWWRRRGEPDRWRQEAIWLRRRLEERTRELTASQRECADLRDEIRGRKLIPPMEIER